MGFRYLAGACAALLLLAATAVHADDAAALLARYRQASGGARWDSITTLEGSGTLEIGGLRGDIVVVQDLATGRSHDRYTLGPVEGADGYDGHAGWQLDPGGEVAALDAPEAKRRARSQAWLDARAFWYPARIAARYGPVSMRELDGRRYAVLEATPDGGDPVGLWFDTGTGLLARIVQREGQDTTTTTLADYREAAGVRVPFRQVGERTDAAGRTDPRARSSITFSRVQANVVVADADFAMPRMAPTARIDDPADVTRIHFDLANNHIYADGSIDGRKARFLVDTGGANLLTPAAAKKFGIVGEGKLAGRGAGDSMVDFSFAHAKEVRLGAAVLDRPVFIIMDLGDLPKVEGVECDGLVGYEMFRRFGVTIDYANRTLSLADMAKFAPPAGAVAVPFELDEHIPIVTGTLDGLAVRMSVDTGSRASLTLHSPFVRAHDLVARYQAAPDAVVGWGVGGASRGRPARFGTLVIGGLAIPGIAGDLYTGVKGAFADPDLAGNLGGGVLRRFTVAFDYAARRMYLAPGTTPAGPDAFDRSGLFVLAEGDALVIADVAAESAAARAGLHAGDRLTAIETDHAPGRALLEWREKFRRLPVGTELRLERERGGSRGTVDLVLADRLPDVAPPAPAPEHGAR